jgi:hypothetical protein
MVSARVYIVAEPFDVAGIQVNHVAITILYSGMNGFETYRLEFGPMVGVTVAAKRTLFQSEKGVVLLTHSEGHIPTSGLVDAGKITTFIPWNGDMIARIEGIANAHTNKLYNMTTNNCRDFAGAVLMDLTGTADALNKVPFLSVQTAGATSSPVPSSGSVTSAASAV